MGRGRRDPARTSDRISARVNPVRGRDFAMSPSIRRSAVVAAALLALAAPALAAAARDPADPRTPVAALYAIEKTGHAPLATPAQRAAALTRGLAAMWDKAEAGARRDGDVAIDFDVVTNSQGADSQVLRADGHERAPPTARPSSRPSTPATGGAGRRAKTSSRSRCCARTGAGASMTSAASPSRMRGRCATCSPTSLKPQ